MLFAVTVAIGIGFMATESLTAPVVIEKSDPDANWMEFKEERGTAFTLDSHGMFSGFTAAHNYVTTSSFVFTIGDVLTITGKSLQDPGADFSIICAVTESSSPFDPGVVGVFGGAESSVGVSFRFPKAEGGFLDFVKVVSIGDGVIRVTNDNGDVFGGDLVVSSDIPGIAMLQTDPPQSNKAGTSIMNSTVAKILQNIDWNDPDDFELINGSKVATLGCVYLCGG